MKRFWVSVVAFMVATAGIAGPAAAQDEIDGLRVTRTERQKLVFTWERQPGVDEYEILIDGTVAGQVESNWFVASDLRVETAYDVQVRADDGTVSDIEIFSTAGAKPREWPLALRSPHPWVSARQVQFNSLAEPTEIRRNGIVIATAAVGVFVDTGLAPETEYTYELQLVTGQAADDRFTRTETVTTVPLLEPVQGVTATIVEPGIAQVSWEPLPPEVNLSYRVYVNGDLLWAPPFINRRTTERRIEIPVGEASSIQVSGFNGGGGPLSDPVVIESPDEDPAAIGLEVTDTWPGTMVLRWNRVDAFETVLFDGVEVAEGRYGWARVTDLPYNQTYEVTVLSSRGESTSYTLTSPTITLGEIRWLQAIETTTTSITIDSQDFRNRRSRNVEVQRDGAVIGTIDREEIDPRTFTDTGLQPGTTYVYTVTEFADGAIGVATPTSITVTTDGVTPGENPPAPEAVNSFVDGSRAVIKVTTSSPDRERQVHQQLEIRRNGELVATIDVGPKWEQFTYFTDFEIDRSETSTYEVISVSSTGYRSAATVLVVPALG